MKMNMKTYLLAAALLAAACVMSLHYETDSKSRAGVTVQSYTFHTFTLEEILSKPRMRRQVH